MINDFELLRPPSLENMVLIDRILNQNSVCLYVRRGDFLKYSIHNVCDLNYFNTLIDLIKKKVNDSVFYIFSDDNEWVQKNLKIEGEHQFIVHNFPDFYEDFRIMKSCKHHIIPNSTFSWWAAWLANSNDKIVVTPETWLNSEEIDYSYFLQADWIKVANFEKKGALKS